MGLLLRYTHAMMQPARPITYRRKNRQHEELADWDSPQQPEQDEVIRSEERVLLIRKSTI